MTTLSISLLVSACVFAGGVTGLYLHRLIPEAVLTRETLDVVKLATGMLSVLASLVLGLLIATAKGSYDNTDKQVRTYAAELLLLDETLRDYGETALPTRRMLRAYTARVLEDLWDSGSPITLGNVGADKQLERVREAIRALRPADDGQRWLQDQALEIDISLLRQRWPLIEQSGPSVRPVVPVILVSWIVAIFASFGMNAPRNRAVLGAFLISSLAIGGSVFLILELDSPLAGLLKISRWPMANAVEQMAE